VLCRRYLPCPPQCVVALKAANRAPTSNWATHWADSPWEMRHQRLWTSEIRAPAHAFGLGKAVAGSPWPRAQGVCPHLGPTSPPPHYPPFSFTPTSSSALRRPPTRPSHARGRPHAHCFGCSPASLDRVAGREYRALHAAPSACGCATPPILCGCRGCGAGRLLAPLPRPRPPPRPCILRPLFAASLASPAVDPPALPPLIPGMSGSGTPS